MLEKEWTSKGWQRTATRTTRQEWAKRSPLAWVLEYQPMISLPGVGQIPLEPYYAQQAFLHDQSTNRALDKMRQGGFTTILSAAEAVFKMLHRPNPAIACLSKNEDDAKGFIDKFTLAYESVKDKEPDWQPLYAKTKFARNKNGIIRALNASKGSGRSISATDVYFDEMPHATFSDEIYTASYPTISRTKGRFTLFSTPLVRGDLFHQICSSPKDFGYSYHQYEWWFVPDYNPYYKQFIKAFLAKDTKASNTWIAKARRGEWYQRTYAAMGEMKFMREYECSFDAGSDQAFSLRQLNNVFYRNYLTEMADEYGDTWRDVKITSEQIDQGEAVSFMDFGRKRDPTIIVTLLMVDNRWRLVEYRRITPMSFVWEFVIGAFRESVARYGSDAYHDGTGSGDAVTIEVSDISTAIVINDNGLSKVKSNAIANTQRAMDNKAVVLPKLPQLQKEFEQYRYNDKKIVQDSVIAVIFALYKAYDPGDSFIGVDTNFSFVGQE